MGNSPKYWFPAKRYGWGWGTPANWQGWAVLVGYVLLMLGGIPLIVPEVNPLGYLAFASALSVLLTLICWVTGEPPRWRWGKSDSRRLDGARYRIDNLRQAWQTAIEPSKAGANVFAQDTAFLPGLTTCQIPGNSFSPSVATVVC